MPYANPRVLNSPLPPEDSAPWHLLDAAGIATREFAAALHRIVPTVCWQPDYRWLPFFRSQATAEYLADPPLQLWRFPVQHGYSRPVVGRLAGFGARTAALLGRGVSAQFPLVCTSCFYAPVAARWPGPVIYYLTDLAAAYDHVNPRQVMALDRALCQVAALVCPNSRRLAAYLVESAGCDPARIAILPNATRQSSVRKAPCEAPTEIPADLLGLPRPFAGVIGNLAGNLDWELIEQSMAAAPAISWVFVGPVSMKIRSRSQSEARRRVMRNRARARFVGFQPYGVLHRYARAFDVAVMPYGKHEPTFSGSATRFYEHLAACRPMLATRGVEELTRKEPLLRLVDSAEQLAGELARLANSGFRDGFEEARWLASHSETWDARAHDLVQAFQARHGYPAVAQHSALAS